MKTYKLSIIQLLLIFIVFLFSEIDAKKTRRAKRPKVRNTATQRIQQPIEVQKQKADTQIIPIETEIKELKKDTPWYESVKLGGLIRIRPEARYNYDFDKFKNDNISFVGAKAQIWIEKEFTQNMKARIVLQDSALWGGEKGSIIGIDTANDNTRQSVGIREAWVESKELIGPVTLQAGRQILKYGDERLVGALEWNNVGRSFNGFRLKIDKELFSTHAWVMIVGEQDSDVAGNSTNLGKRNSFPIQYNCPPNSFSSSACTLTTELSKQQQGDATFTGFYNTFKSSDLLHIDAYYIGLYKKWLPQNNSTILLLPNPETIPRDSRYDQLHTFGFRLSNKTTPDKKAKIPFDFSIEYAIQNGKNGLNVTPNWDILNTNVSTVDPLTGKTVTNSIYKEKQSYDAYAFAFDIGYTIGPFRFGGIYDIGSGDPNRKDGKVATFSNLFHSNHGFFGEADQVSWVNMVGKSVNFTWDGGKFGKLKIAYWIIDKQKRQDGWYDVTGNLKEGASTESATNERFKDPYVQSEKGALDQRGVVTLGKNLFREIDMIYSFEYNHILWSFGGSWIFAGDAVRRKLNDDSIYPEFRKTNFLPQAQFGYLMMTVQF
ncbi:alginate export family protein [Leptospira borgpetersenii]|uniref:alginate export family protein n=1 Tax=Leptospira borgpetersenii TaxID=174 RepID=UPI00077444BE|nr:alginate export family protein [Leptospira borgpetersenii]MBE8364447.1 alginate export family protein [Leptospira borgpetersenii serovar Balcanica]MBE8367777.1 alginate export family protein [Leptospira borgpetersenii serovar Balcanica]MBE8423535.1 alginate export family protein [Leptospira borgpetersenii serovar Balcanica]MBF3350632.1 alginate export family protein [Leptospira borgpetersenii serovar Balcanica]